MIVGKSRNYEVKGAESPDRDVVKLHVHMPKTCHITRNSEEEMLISMPSLISSEPEPINGCLIQNEYDPLNDSLFDSVHILNCDNLYE